MRTIILCKNTDPLTGAQVNLLRTEVTGAAVTQDLGIQRLKGRWHGFAIVLEPRDLAQ